jgi:phage FluMu protein Com
MTLPPPDPQQGAGSDTEPRCWRCDKKLAELVSRPWIIVCVRCKARNQAARVE